MVEAGEVAGLADEDWELAQDVRAPAKYVKEAVEYAAQDLGYDLCGWAQVHYPSTRSDSLQGKKVSVASLRTNWGCKGMVRLMHAGFSNSKLPEYVTTIAYDRNLEGMLAGDEKPEQFFEVVNKYLESCSNQIEAEEQQMADLLETEPETAVDWVCSNGRDC